MSDKELLAIVRARIESQIRLYLSVDISPEYNSAYADGMSDAFKALMDAGVTGFGDLTEIIPRIFNEVKQINEETKGAIH